MMKKHKSRLGSSSRSSPSKGIGNKILLNLSVLMILGIGWAGVVLFENESPKISLKKDIKFLGGPMDIPFQALDQKSGIRHIAIKLRQNSMEHQLFTREFDRQAWFSKAGPTEIKETISIDPEGSGAKEGKAELIITVEDFSLRGNTAELNFPVTVDSTPPRVLIEHAQRYMQQGGSGIVVYEVSEASERHGVMLDDVFFQGYPLKKGDTKRFISYIALQWNNKKPTDIRVIAEDQAGNQGKASFTFHFKKAKEKKDQITVSDGFLQKKIPEFQESYPELQGTDLEKYLFVNNTIRIQNAKKIAEICRNTVDHQLWHDRFFRMPGAGRAGFADQRTYFYQGKPIDHQTHLGIDLASTARVEIKAANKGKVIFADYLGIYGHAVILDHGQGLSSLYSHLSRIETELDKIVEKDELIGRSGRSGMAGGDHLHYSMLIHGIFITPVEWWDQHWIDDNINEIIK
ncbi:MAG: M23 family metallopeptidase [Candidatus Electrothrix sp. AR3]|nr:M23 family metallopeptidase [Candidatus Electrothrix sp. AR3]